MIKIEIIDLQIRAREVIALELDGSLPRRRRVLFDLWRPMRHPSLQALLQARLDEVAVGDALKVICAQQARGLLLQPSAQKPFDIWSWACALPTRHCGCTAASAAASALLRRTNLKILMFSAEFDRVGL